MFSHLTIAFVINIIFHQLQRLLVPNWFNVIHHVIGIDMFSPVSLTLLHITILSHNVCILVERTTLFVFLWLNPLEFMHTLHISITFTSGVSFKL